MSKNEKTDAMNASYHGALAPLEAAGVEAGMVCVSNLMAGSGRGPRPLVLLGRHGRLLFNQAPLQNKKVLIRDFSSIPLAAVFPFLGAWKKKAWWLVNHNLQWAQHEYSERIAFRALGKMGVRFLFLEEVPGGALTDLGLDARRYAAVPHPVPEGSIQRSRSGGVRTVGIVGEFRPEKGIDELLEVLKPLSSLYRVVVALPNRADFLAQSHFAQADWFEQVDTTSATAYHQALADCDVVLLNHPAEGYTYRASGLIADAAAAHVPVIVRKLPMLRHQVEWPVRVGRCFERLEEIPQRLQDVSEDLKAGGYDFEAYRAARSGAALTERMRELCAMLD